MLVSVYIRKDDEDKWRALEKKTEAIHNMLNSVHVYDIPVKQPKEKTPDTVAVKAVMDPPNVYKLCKHGADPAFCKFAQPGKLCK